MFRRATENFLFMRMNCQGNNLPYIDARRPSQQRFSANCEGKVKVCLNKVPELPVPVEKTGDLM